MQNYLIRKSMPVEENYWASKRIMHVVKPYADLWVVGEVLVNLNAKATVVNLV